MLVKLEGETRRQRTELLDMIRRVQQPADEPPAVSVRRERARQERLMRRRVKRRAKDAARRAAQAQGKASEAITTTEPPNEQAA